MSWLMSGEESVKAMEAEKAAAEKRKAEAGKAFRFFIMKDKETGSFPDAEVIFLDGEIYKPTGALAPPRFYEHTIMHQGRWTQFVCPKMTFPKKEKNCPFCEANDRPSLVSLFTVIDLRPYTTKDNKIIPFTRKLYVAKQTTFETLNKLAVKRGGLSNWRVTISRNGEKDPNVGNVFDFGEKITDIEAAKKQFTTTFKTKDQSGKEVQKTVCLYEPLKYDEEIVFRTDEELRKMGFGAPASSMSAAPEVPADTAAGSPEAFEGQV